MPRDLPPPTGSGRATGVTGQRSRNELREIREETDALPLPADWDASAPAEDDELPEDDERDLPPLSAAPMGTRDRPPTRVESPVARRPSSGARGPRTPHPPPPPTPERAEDRIGTTLGAYRLHALIGKGGMGFVYRAEHARLGREVALKLLRADYSRRKDSVSRFFQEARTVNRIRHRNIVDVTDFVELEDGTTFIIMELLRGQSLGSWARHAFDLTRALGLLIQICDGLSAAHAVGVIHRDLKPDNVVVMPTGDGAETVKLLDFGVAKLLNRDDEDVGLETAAGSVIGTPAYMSPEQAGGLPIDARADIYSLGAIMYELFCGVPLFRGRSFGEYVRKHLNELPVPPRETPRGADLDPRLERILMRSLEKDPNRRYQSVDELRLELLELLASFEPTEPLPTGQRFHRSGRVELPLAPGPLTPAAPMLSHRTPAPPMQSQRTPPPELSSQRTPPPRLSGQQAVPPPGLVTGERGPYATVPPLDRSLGSSTAPPLDRSLAESLISLEPSLAPRSRTRLWLAAGAAIVTGIGVTAALIAGARDNQPAPAPTPPPASGSATEAPQVTGGAPAPGSAVAPAAAKTVALVEVRVDAPSGARVLRAGSDVEVCVAPCRLSIDPADGDSPLRREYVVRLDGFGERTITIDLTAPPMAIAVPFDDAAEPVDDAPSATDPTPMVDDGAGPDRSGTARRRPGKPAPATTTATPAGAEVEPATPTPPTTPPATTPRKRQTIDPTDTIDPFAGQP